MKVEETFLKGCYVITPKVIYDDRGGFFESFNQKEFEKHTGLSVNFVQDNQSISKKGVLRGLHFQKDEHAQAKLLRVVKGKVLDVCVDLRENSDTFGKHFSIVLDGNNNKQLFVPRGFAHGFLALEDQTFLSYKCDNFYYQEAERGLLYNDTDLNIDWNFPEDQLILSQKDKVLPTLKNRFK